MTLDECYLTALLPFQAPLLDQVQHSFPHGLFRILKSRPLDDLRLLMLVDVSVPFRGAVRPQTDLLHGLMGALVAPTKGSVDLLLLMNIFLEPGSHDRRISHSRDPKSSCLSPLKMCRLTHHFAELRGFLRSLAL
mgnify:CR=1 FL=1